MTICRRRHPRAQLLCLLSTALLAGAAPWLRADAGVLVGPFPPQDKFYRPPADPTEDAAAGAGASRFEKGLGLTGNMLSTSPAEFQRCRVFDPKRTVADFEVQVDLPVEQQKTVRLGLLGLSTNSEDNSDAFRRGVEACRGQPCTLRLPPGGGTYRFTQSIWVEDVADLTVDGQGAKLVFGFRDNFRPLLTVRRAERFLLKDLSIDWNWGVYRIATLMRTINYEERNGKANWTLEMPDVEDFDINTIYNWDSAFALDIDSLTPGLAGVNDIWDLPVTRVTKLSANRIRLGLGGPLAVRPRAGTVWLVRHFGYEIHAMWIEACMHCTLDGVTVYSAPGMALTFEDESGNIAIKNFNIGVLPNSARQISSATDGIHLAGTKGEILIENVTIANQYDDCININDPVSVGFRILDKNTILATDWRNGRIVYKAGDTVAFRNADYSDSGVSAVVESATYQDGGWKIRLTTALPKFQGQTSKMFVLNTSRYSARNVIIRGLFCHSTRARGVVLQATNSVIEQSCFTDIQQEAICISSEIFLGRWAEGTGTTKTVLDSNTILRVDKQDTGHGAIFSGASWADGFGLSSAVHSDLVVSNSIINETFNRAIVLQMYDNVVISGNVVANQDAGSSNIGAIRVRKASNVRINNNKWAYRSGINATTPGAKVQIETRSTFNVYGNGNQMLPANELKPALVPNVQPIKSKAATTTTEEVAVEPTASLSLSLTPSDSAPTPTPFEVKDNPLGQVGTKITVDAPIVLPTETAKIPNLVGARRAPRRRA